MISNHNILYQKKSLQFIFAVPDILFNLVQCFAVRARLVLQSSFFPCFWAKPEFQRLASVVFLFRALSMVPFQNLSTNFFLGAHGMSWSFICCQENKFISLDAMRIRDTMGRFLVLLSFKGNNGNYYVDWREDINEESWTWSMIITGDLSGHCCDDRESAASSIARENWRTLSA